jgi:hypothetical protein
MINEDIKIRSVLLKINLVKPEGKIIFVKSLYEKNNFPFDFFMSP